jgi:ribosomal protein L11 methyltransferase
MREITIRLRSASIEEALDRLLPLVPGGVRERPGAPGHTELILRGADLPPASLLAESIRPVRHEISERSVSDDWRRRRLDDYRPEPIGGRLIVRPVWAPPAGEGQIEIVLSEGGAFGEGTHPTTRTCLEMMLGLSPGGSFADLGCGSGVLAILAAMLGWDPVTAVDVDASSVEVARANARRNSASITAEVVDLQAVPAPASDGFAANVPMSIHAILAERWARDGAPAVGLISGFVPQEAAAVLAVYAGCGLYPSRQVQAQGWVVAELRRG